MHDIYVPSAQTQMQRMFILQSQHQNCTLLHTCTADETCSDAVIAAIPYSHPSFVQNIISLPHMQPQPFMSAA
jgi:hypothetical protein